MNKYFVKISTFLFALFVSINSYAQDEISVVPLSEQQAIAPSSDPYPTMSFSQSESAKQIKAMNFETAKKSLQNQILQASKKKQDTAELDALLRLCDNGISALRGTNKIVFIDSVVVDKDALLSAYKFDTELGSISLSADNQLASFTTELGNLTYRTEKDADNKLSIRSYFVEDGTITNGKGLNGISLDGDMNYPFLMSDGTTLYFASRSAEGHGNYDLYVTRYDSEEGTYLQPTNLGFPFNSYANDYLMVVDESLGIGWFASDRNQPKDKVCVYTFLQPKSRNTFDFDVDEHSAIIKSAKIHSIKETWNGNEDAIRSARQALTLKQNANPASTNKHDFTFVVNDNYTYYTLSDFKNAEAKAAFIAYQNKQKELESLSSTLENLRTSAQGSTIRSQILQLETQVSSLSAELSSMRKQIRSLELK